MFLNTLLLLLGVPRSPAASMVPVLALDSQLLAHLLDLSSFQTAGNVGISRGSMGHASGGQVQHGADVRQGSGPSSHRSSGSGVLVGATAGSRYGSLMDDYSDQYSLAMYDAMAPEAEVDTKIIKTVVLGFDAATEIHKMAKQLEEINVQQEKGLNASKYAN